MMGDFESNQALVVSSRARLDMNFMELEFDSKLELLEFNRISSSSSSSSD